MRIPVRSSPWVLMTEIAGLAVGWALGDDNAIVGVISYVFLQRLCLPLELLGLKLRLVKFPLRDDLLGDEWKTSQASLRRETTPRSASSCATHR